MLLISPLVKDQHFNSKVFIVFWIPSRSLIYYVEIGDNQSREETSCQANQLKMVPRSAHLMVSVVILQDVSRTVISITIAMHISPYRLFQTLFDRKLKGETK